MIRNPGYTALNCTTRTTEHDALIVFHAMAQNPATTMIADWRQGMNRTLKTIEYMRLSGHRHFE